MPGRSPVTTDAAPAALGPYSQAIRHGDLLYCSGQIPLDPQSGEPFGDSIPDETRQCLRNLAAVCEAAGGVEVALALAVDELRALARDEDDAPARHRLRHVGEGVPEAADVSGGGDP